MNIGVGRGMFSIFVYKKYRMEYLLREVRIHGGGDVCDVPQIAINEFAQADVIVHGALSAAAGDEEFKVWDAECILRVNQQKGDSAF